MNDINCETCGTATPPTELVLTTDTGVNCHACSVIVASREWSPGSDLTYMPPSIVDEVKSVWAEREREVAA